MRRTVAALSLVLFLAPRSASPQTTLDGIDAVVEQVMKDWKVPGLGLAVVRDGKVILSKGYGLRDVAKNQPVTPKTLFAIGSITKSFTVSALGVLADEGKLDWDKPVRTYFPSFQVQDAVASERMTPRDLVTHRSGLPRHDLLWYNSPLGRQQMVERLRFLEPSKDFRSTFQYNNLMFMTAGFLAGELDGKTWEESVRKRILEPLGMRATNFSVQDSQTAADFAHPYKKTKDEVKEVPFRVIDNVGPAGSINSSVEDMTQYVLFHLAKGKHDGKQVLSENNAVQMQTPQMVIQQPIEWNEVPIANYGMAFMIAPYRGHNRVQHGGNIDGFSALVSFLPQDGIGLVALANLDGTPLPEIVEFAVYDRLLALEPIPWNQRLLEHQKKGEESEAEAKKKGFTTRREGTKLSHTIADYAGEYEHPAYGVFKIEIDGNDLRGTINRIASPLKHFHYDVFEIPEDPLNPMEKSKVTFVTNLKGDVDSLSIALEPNVKDIVFMRAADRSMRQKSFLEPLAGEYEVGGTPVRVSLKGESTLILTVPGQPEYELVPSRGLAFDLKGVSGFSLEFKKDAAGVVTEAAVFQPNGTFVAKRKR